MCFFFKECRAAQAYRLFQADQAWDCSQAGLEHGSVQVDQVCDYFEVDLGCGHSEVEQACGCFQVDQACERFLVDQACNFVWVLQEVLLYHVQTIL